MLFTNEYQCTSSQRLLPSPSPIAPLHNTNDIVPVLLLRAKTAPCCASSLVSAYPCTINILLCLWALFLLPDSHYALSLLETSTSLVFIFSHTHRTFLWILLQIIFPGDKTEKSCSTRVKTMWNIRLRWQCVGVFLRLSTCILFCLRIK